MIARQPAQKFVDRDAERLALDVPQRHVEAAQRMNLLAAGRVEVAAIHDLPEVLDTRRILTDDHGPELLDRILRAALADPRDALIGLHRDHVAALVEDRPAPRVVVIADARDLHLWQRAPRRRLPAQKRPCCQGR